MCLVAQLCPTLCDPINCSLPGSPVLGISQAIILEWVAISYSRDLPDPGIEPKSPVSPALAGGLLTTEPPGKPINRIVRGKYIIHIYKCTDIAQCPKKSLK